MPSVQWGSITNAHLTFTPLGSALGALSNGAGTIALLWKPVKNSLRADGAELLNSTEATAYAGLCLGDGGTGQWADDNGSSWVVSTSTPAFGDWYISVVDWPATAAKARFHWKDLTTAGAWSHEDSVGNGLAAFAGPGSTGHWNIGYSSDGGGNGMQIALVAAWNVRLGDTNATLLSTNSRTSDWANNPAGAPVFLSEITSLTPSDLIGASTFSAASSLTTNLTVGGAPTGGWTFDGLGSVALFRTGADTSLSSDAVAVRKALRTTGAEASASSDTARRGFVRTAVSASLSSDTATLAITPAGITLTGTCTLVAGAATIVLPSAAATDRIWLSRVISDGALGRLTFTITPGVGFAVNSSSATEKSTVAWTLERPARPADVREVSRLAREQAGVETAWPGFSRLFVGTSIGLLMSELLLMSPSLLMGTSSQPGLTLLGSFNAGASGRGIQYAQIVADGGIITADPTVIDSLRRSGSFTELDPT